MENSRYVYKNGKRLRTGYTTGSCAAAASKAAAAMLFTGKAIEQVEIDTPKGWRLKLDVRKQKLTETQASCCIIKDSGDDPDITDGIEVYAVAKKTDSQGIVMKAGTGIGVVTRAGLSVAPGKPAINPVPMKMIMEEVAGVLPEGAGVELELYIPRGEELAARTYNPRLGIVGGLSVLGTSGIVEPMSEEAIKDTIEIELSCLKVSGTESAVLVPGNYGEDFCRQWMGISSGSIVKISNYLGFALEKCAELGFKRLLLAGHIGKLVKPAGGIFYTHSRVSDTRMEILTAYLAVLGMEREKLIKVMECRTTEEAMPIIAESGFGEVYSILAEKCAARCEEYVYGTLEVGTVIFSMKEKLAESSKTQAILEEIRNE